MSLMGLEPGNSRLISSRALHHWALILESFLKLYSEALDKLDKSLQDRFIMSQTKHMVGTQKNRLNETVLLRTNTKFRVENDE